MDKQLVVHFYRAFLRTIPFSYPTIPTSRSFLLQEVRSRFRVPARFDPHEAQKMLVMVQQSCKEESLRGLLLSGQRGNTTLKPSKSRKEMLDFVRSHPLNLASRSRIIPKKEEPVIKKEKEEETLEPLEWRNGVPVVYGGTLYFDHNKTPYGSVLDLLSAISSPIKTLSPEKKVAEKDSTIEVVEEDVVAPLVRDVKEKSFEAQNTERLLRHEELITSPEAVSTVKKEPLPTLSTKEINMTLPEKEDDGGNLVEATLRDLDPINFTASPSRSRISPPQTLNSDVLSHSYLNNRKADTSPPSP